MFSAVSTTKIDNGYRKGLGHTERSIGLSAFYYCCKYLEPYSQMIATEAGWKIFIREFVTSGCFI